MGNKKDLSKYSSIIWREKELLYRCNHNPNSAIYYTVSGFKRKKEIELIPIKLRRKCRAFLRGTRNETGIRGLSKIIFKK